MNMKTTFKNYGCVTTTIEKFTKEGKRTQDFYSFYLPLEFCN
jgi:hypothetical protein